MVIQWFPGHMAKAKRQMEESLKRVDSIVYLLDARAPFSCINPEFDNLIAQKPTLFVINKCDMITSAVAEGWKKYFEQKGMKVVLTSSTIGKDSTKVLNALAEVNKEKIERNKAKGINYAVKAMVIGMPNTGKSTLINCLCKGKKTITGNKPGVTKCEQWVRLDNGITLLDTPGTLCHSIKNTTTALNLAFIGSIRDAVVDTDELALELIALFVRKFPKNLQDRYDVPIDGTPLEILEQIAVKRSLTLKGGEVDYSRAAIAVIDDFRKRRLGNVVLEMPNEK